MRVVKCSSEIDWLTATIRHGAAGSDIVSWGNRIDAVMGELPELVEPRPWSWMGYQGKTVPGLSWGTREDGRIVRASGQCASHAARAFYGTAIRASRLDFALTLWYAKDDPGKGYRARDESIAHIAKAETTTGNRMTFVEGFGRGDTLYVGARTSAKFGRLYDKWRESKDDWYQYAWRAEVEYKSGFAANALEWWYTRTDGRKEIAKTVSKWWRDHGVYEVPMLGEGQAFEPSIPRPAATDLSRLRWLASQVAPAVRGLAERGLLEDAKRAIFDTESDKPVESEGEADQGL